MEKYIKSNSPWGPRTIRMVNQPEIHDFIIKNPGLTENQIMLKLYSFDRQNSIFSNKKYADRLRSLLYSGKIDRVKAQTVDGKRYIYFATTKV